MKKKNQKLTYTPEADFHLIGIASHENDYRLSWLLNKELLINLIRTENLEINNIKKNTPDIFSVYTTEGETEGNFLTLISNRSDNAFLIEELRNIDFFLKLPVFLDSKAIDSLLKKIRNIDSVITALKINLSDFPSWQKLVF